MIRIFGSSDDLIEIRGDIRAEFNADEALLLASDGSLVSIEYGEILHATRGSIPGWEVRLERISSGAEMRQAGTREENDYTEELVLHGDFDFVAIVDEVRYNE